MTKYRLITLVDGDIVRYGITPFVGPTGVYVGEDFERANNMVREANTRLVDASQQLAVRVLNETKANWDRTNPVTPSWPMRRAT